MVPICLCCLNCTKFGQLILRKIIEIVATRCQILSLKCTKFSFGWGSAPDPAGGAHRGREGRKRRGGWEGGGRGREGRGKGKGCGGARKVVCPGARAGSRRAYLYQCLCIHMWDHAKNCTVSRMCLRTMFAIKTLSKFNLMWALVKSLNLILLY